MASVKDKVAASNVKDQKRVAKKYHGEIGLIEPNFPPVLRDGPVVPQAKAGALSIGPLDKSGPGFKIEPLANADPKVNKRAAYSGTSKT